MNTKENQEYVTYLVARRNTSQTVKSMLFKIGKIIGLEGTGKRNEKPIKTIICPAEYSPQVQHVNKLIKKQEK